MHRAVSHRLVIFEDGQADANVVSGALGVTETVESSAWSSLREAEATWGIGFGGFEEPPSSLAGPYGGTMRLSGLTFTLSGYSAVPGLRLSGSLHVFRPASGVTFPLTFVGSVRVAGPKAAHGSLTVGRTTLAGRLSGRRVRARA